MRATLASLVAMILVAVSCAASACSVQCDLHGFPSSCHHAAQGASHKMAGMGATMSLSSGAQVDLSHAMTPCCEQCVCVQLPAQLKPEAASTLNLDFIQQASIVTWIDRPVAKSLPEWLSHRPPLRDRGLVSLHTILRV